MNEFPLRPKKKYTTEDKANVKRYLKELTQSAECVGDSCDMACVATTKGVALRKFKKLADDNDIWYTENMPITCVFRGFLHVPEVGFNTDDEGETVEWYVTRMEKSPYKVWMYVEEV